MSAGQSIPDPAELDAVTLDANGTLLHMLDPVPALVDLLAAHGIERAPDAVREAFATEGAFYTSREFTGRDDASLAVLRRDCVAVFLASLDAELDAASFADSYVGAFRFELLPDTLRTLRILRRRGLALAVVSNWDVSLHARADELSLTPLVDTIVTSAEAGTSKPDPLIFEIALGRLNVRPHRALHVGDSPADEHGAKAAGMRFAHVPLGEAFASWN